MIWRRLGEGLEKGLIDGVGLHLTYFHQMTVLGCT
ncbi:hypothetical protein SPLC1_S051660 [Arthrospira platensis C1]|nr:hypothetical protein SPLC1_S051660 [Arthrospira platensis C1]